jgi:hypothetical protein
MYLKAKCREVNKESNLHIVNGTLKSLKYSLHCVGHEVEIWWSILHALTSLNEKKLMGQRTA